MKPANGRKGGRTQRGWEGGRKEGKNEKWFSTDGLSSEVRLKRTEVNNGCLVKGRSSQSGSNKKEKKEKKKQAKIKNSLKSFWGEAARLHLSERAAHSVTCHNYPSTPWIFQPQQSSEVVWGVLCVCAWTVSMCIYTTVYVCVCACEGLFWSVWERHGYWYHMTSLTVRSLECWPAQMAVPMQDLCLRLSRHSLSHR